MEKVKLNTRSDFERVINDYLSGEYPVDGIDADVKEPTEYPCVMCFRTVEYQDGFHTELDYVIIYLTDF